MTKTGISVIPLNELLSNDLIASIKSFSVKLTNLKVLKLICPKHLSFRFIKSFDSPLVTD